MISCIDILLAVIVGSNALLREISIILERLLNVLYSYGNLIQSTIEYSALCHIMTVMLHCVVSTYIQALNKTPSLSILTCGE